MVIRKVRGMNKWRLLSKKTGRNLGIFDSIKAAKKRERVVAYFKHR